MVGANMPQAAGFMVRGGGAGGFVPGQQGYQAQGADPLLAAANALDNMKSDMLKPKQTNNRSTQNGSPAQWMDNLIQFEKATDGAVQLFVDTLQGNVSIRSRSNFCKILKTPTGIG